MMRIELMYSDFQSDALPLSYIALKIIRAAGLEPTSSGPKPKTLPIMLCSEKKNTQYGT